MPVALLAQAIDASATKHTFIHSIHTDDYTVTRYLLIADVCRLRHSGVPFPSSYAELASSVCACLWDLYLLCIPSFCAESVR